MRRLSPRELATLLAQAEQPPLLLDVREPWEFELCHISGSVSVPLRQLGAQLASLDPQRPTVVICHHGARSLRSAQLLEQAGFREVINLDGGVAAWSATVDPELPTY